MVSRIAPGLKHMDADLSPERQKKGINADQQGSLSVARLMAHLCARLLAFVVGLGGEAFSRCVLSLHLPTTHRPKRWGSKDLAGLDPDAKFKF